MNRLFALFVLPLLVAAGPGRSPAAPPNVLLIVVDDLRPELGCYGVKGVRSPNIDRLASEGLVFRRAYCQIPVCGASRASLLSGLRPLTNRFLDYDTWKDKDAPGVASLPAHFKANGYTAISNGKIYHHRTDDRAAWTEDPWFPKGNWVGWRAYITQANKNAAWANQGKGPAWEIAEVKDGAYPDGQIANKTIGDLRRLKEAGKPFFLAAGFLKPHLPFNAPKKYWDLYRRDDLPRSTDPWGKGAPRRAFHQFQELRYGYTGIPAQGPLSEDLARTLVHGYYACVSYADAQIGRVLAELDTLGLSESTVVALLGDHGWNLGDHGMWCKHCCFETSLRSPLILRGAGVARGATDALVEFVDLYPTLCGLTGLEAPGHLEGTDLGPLLKNPARAWKKAVFSDWKGGRSVRTDRYRYTEWRQNGKLLDRMMFDHERDSAELVNLAETSDTKEFEAALRNGWKVFRPD